MWHDGPMFKFFLYIVFACAFLGLATLTCIIGLGVWKFVELIS
jgi:hypothetical protein